MGKLLGIATLILVVGAVTGCSTLLPSPILACIHVKGPANQTREFIFSIERPSENELDLQLSDRSMIQIDLQWLWLEKSDLMKPAAENSTDHPVLLIPWLMFKYRF